jgi:hypothetical protein
MGVVKGKVGICICVPRYVFMALILWVFKLIELRSQDILMMCFCFLMNRMEKFLPHFCYNCGRGLAYDGAVVDVFLYITISCYKNAVYSNLDHTVENFTYSCGHSCVSVCMGWN